MPFCRCLLHILLSYIRGTVRNLRMHGPCRKKNANNKGADQSVELCSLISAFVISSVQSMIIKLASCKI